MAIDIRPFPKDIRVVVQNENKAEPQSKDKFSGHCQFQFDGELYDFPPGVPVMISPEAAYFLFLYDTRSEIDPNTGRDTGVPRNYRDMVSTGQLGNLGIGNAPTLWVQRLMALGWANNSDFAKRFEKFKIKTMAFSRQVSQEAFASL